MLTKLAPALAALLVSGLALMPGEAPAAYPGAAAALAKASPRLAVEPARHRHGHRARGYRQARLGKYFFCPDRYNVCHLTPRLVWTPSGYRRVWYVRELW